MTSQLLTRSSYSRPTRPELTFLGELALAYGRAHEFCGQARRMLAALVAARTEGSVFWIAPRWQADRLNPEGVCRLFNPGRLTFLDPLRAEDLLWCAEEVLRAGAVPLMVVDLPQPPGIVAVRRLHLAAETGKEISGNWPLGLLLTPGQGGAPGIESRWRLEPDHGANTRRAWRLDRLRARTAPQKSWELGPKGGRFVAKPLSERDVA